MPDEVVSPCQQICQLDPQTGYCIGCLRTLNEIADWLEMSNEEKRAVLEKINERKKATT